MKKIAFLLFLLSFISVAAQQRWPEAYIVQSDSAKYVDIPDDNWQRLNTYEEHITLKQVASTKYDTMFAKAKSSRREFFKCYSWVRYKIKNTDTKNVLFTFSANKGRQDFYVKAEGNKWIHYVAGDMVPWSERSGIKDISEVPFELAPGQEVFVYIDMGQITAFNDIQPSIGNYFKVIEEHYLKAELYQRDDVISFGFFGFIIFAMIFNLFFYYVNREKVYFVFSLLLLFSALLLGKEVLSSLWFNEYRQLYTFFMVFTVTGFIIMLLNTTRFFFRVNVHFKGWDMFLRYYSIFVGFAGVFVYMGLINKWFIFLIVVATLVGLAGFAFIVALIVMLISLLKKKDKEARLFVTAALPFLVSPILNAIIPSQWVYTMCGVWTILALSWGMFARYKRLHEENARAALEREEERNRLVAAQKEELEILVEVRTAALQQSLEDLKQTQNQLIQSEKMASLGELTAGIAHEIQNPLNFVNNFSDVSIELLDEMGEELDKGDTEEAKAIAGDIKQNLEKIAHHGRRADGIVKGMLQHSRASSGNKEAADINKLTDEYLRLAYHGLRAKDKSFNADLVTNFTDNLPQPRIVPQDVGRVLLNMFTNAFYAMQEKGKQSQSVNYKPVVTVSTKQVGNTIEITVKDNGTGIPDEIKDKIMQPFFTTKPTGQGTGLGLSLSYDIIVKAHGGNININSVEGEGTEFIITLPV
ncbi:sensor histidine kinase [Flavobacterium psychrotrophum]|uniref:sensor histidine kinase n=1 Tax=Flavobacterium psychrotrophum TaxID=2294119 RepID=UPI000E317080|nr:ATP-binding protein [Flavobacterium psychrotrophum]